MRPKVVPLVQFPTPALAGGVYVPQVIGAHEPVDPHTPFEQVAATPDPVNPALQVYAHVEPLAVLPLPHPFTKALGIATDGGLLHGLVETVQLPTAVQVPLEHDALGNPLNPD